MPIFEVPVFAMNAPPAVAVAIAPEKITFPEDTLRIDEDSVAWR
jgi:hypothetical protein